MIDLLSNLHPNRFMPAMNILFGLVLVGSLFSVAAQASTIVQIEPPTLTMEFGEKAQFSVEIMNAENLYGFELHISYDPTKVRVVDGDPSSAGIQLLPGDMYEVGQGFLVANEADNEAGKALFAFTLLTPAPLLAGDGTLVMVDVKAIGEGSSAIDLEGVILASPDGEALPFVANDGEVIIESAPEVTPSLTATSVEQSALTATMPVSPTGTLNGTTSVSPLPTMLLASSTLVSTQETTPPALSTMVNSQIPSQVNHRSKTFGLAILGTAILMIGGALFLILRWGFRRR